AGRARGHRGLPLRVGPGPDEPVRAPDERLLAVDAGQEPGRRDRPGRVPPVPAGPDRRRVRRAEGPDEAAGGTASMSSGDKTEEPTPKKLRDAREKGQVPQSRDATSTALLIVVFGYIAVMWHPALARFKAEFDLIPRLYERPIDSAPAAPLPPTP